MGMVGESDNELANILSLKKLSLSGTNAYKSHAFLL